MLLTQGMVLTASAMLSALKKVYKQQSGSACLDSCKTEKINKLKREKYGQKEILSGVITLRYALHRSSV